MTTTRPIQALTGALTAVEKSPPPQAPRTPHKPSQGSLRTLTWTSMACAALIGCGAGIPIGYSTAAATIEPEPVIIDANAACRDGMTAAARALDARERAAAQTNDVLAATSTLYGALLTGSALDVDQATDAFTGTHMLHERQDTRARAERRAFQDAAMLCPPGW